MDYDGASSLDQAPLVLPDSRLADPLKGVVRGTPAGFSHSMNWVPVFCANCGKPHGYVPEENCSFACWLCDPCADKWGEQYGMGLMPDEVFWALAHAEMLEKYGRILTEQEARTEAEAGLTPLSQLLRERK